MKQFDQRIITAADAETGGPEARSEERRKKAFDFINELGKRVNLRPTLAVPQYELPEPLAKLLAEHNCLATDANETLHAAIKDWIREPLDVHTSTDDAIKIMKRHRSILQGLAEAWGGIKNAIRSKAAVAADLCDHLQTALTEAETELQKARKTGRKKLASAGLRVEDHPAYPSDVAEIKFNRQHIEPLEQVKAATARVACVKTSLQGIQHAAASVEDHLAIITAVQLAAFGDATEL